eukprot:1067607-Prorocentrum_minimum.AAC.1
MLAGVADAAGAGAAHEEAAADGRRREHDGGPSDRGETLGHVLRARAGGGRPQPHGADARLLRGGPPQGPETESETKRNEPAVSIIRLLKWVEQ